MAVNRNIYKFGNIIGNYRNFLFSRTILHNYQPIATLKQSIEAKLGLPAQPKRPVSPYFKFMMKIRPSLIEKHPGLKFTEISKLISLEWQKADKDFKDQLSKEFQTRFDEYRRANISYFQSITNDQKKLIEVAKIQAQNLKEKKLLKKKFEDLGKPKRPPTSWGLFLLSASIKRGDLPISEWQKVMQAKWKALPQEEKEVYSIRAATAMKEYLQKKNLWEMKMIDVNNNNAAQAGAQQDYELKKRRHYTGRN